MAGRGYIEFNYAMYVCIYIYLVLYLYTYILFLFTSFNYIHDLAVEKRTLVPVGMMHIPSCSRVHTSQDDSCFRLDQQ